MSPVLSGTFGSDVLQSRGQPLLLLSCHLDKPAHWSSCQESHNLWVAEHEVWDSTAWRALGLPEMRENDFVLTGLSEQNKHEHMESPIILLPFRKGCAFTSLIYLRGTCSMMKNSWSDCLHSTLVPWLPNYCGSVFLPVKFHRVVVRTRWICICSWIYMKRIQFLRLVPATE